MQDLEKREYAVIKFPDRERRELLKVRSTKPLLKLMFSYAEVRALFNECVAAANPRVDEI